MKNKLLTLPNIVTLANLLCGCVAVVFALDGRFDVAFWLIASAAVFDFADGAVARLTGQYSAVGRELDSLADVVSFGVAPSMVLFARYGASFGVLPQMLGVAVFAVALFSALRLAKFNVDETQRDEFSGLPTPAAALAIAALGATWGDVSRVAILVLVAVVSYLLVCPLRMFSLKFKTLGWRGNELRWAFLAASAVLVAMLGVAGVAAVIGLYIVASAARGVVCRKK
jgi:CDP-diacylglycerol--serine O-phosphatidyltransferase